MTTWEPNLDAAEEMIGHRFADRTLLAIALDTSRAGFGALESLGDSVNDLAITAYVLAAGLPHPEAPRLASNEHLRAVAKATIGRFARVQTTGDVIESVVGAIHLDAGYDAAARVGVALCANGARPIAPIAGPLGAKDLRWLGQQASDAFLTDLAIERMRPNWPTQLELDRARRRGSLASGLAPLARDPLVDIGREFATTGWRGAYALFTGRRPS